MPPKKRAKRFDKEVGAVEGIPYTLYEDGLLKVGTTSSRSSVRLQAGADVKAEVRKAAGLPAAAPEQPQASENRSREELQAAGSEEPVLSMLNPSTRCMDEEPEEPALPVLPHSMASLDDDYCLVCASDECADGIELPCGFFCGECAAIEFHRKSIVALAEAQLDERSAAAKHQTRPERPRLEPRRSTRASKPVVQIYDLDRSGKGQPGWSAYELSRTGTQHSGSREESYSEVQAERDQLRARIDAARREHGELAAALDGVYSRLQRLVLPAGEATADVDCDAAAALVLRAAITELVEDHERRQDVGRLSAQDEQQPDPDPPQNTAEATPTPASRGLPPPPWPSVQASMDGPGGLMGELSLSEEGLSWWPAARGSGNPQLQICLHNIVYVARVQIVLLCWPSRAPPWVQVGSCQAASRADGPCVCDAVQVCRR